ncbi:hypothetical protein HK405_001730 [Cladochytrium tenue]|nr:hypothetical protein HK405_001730 [Cladochytrium tenue]
MDATPPRKEDQVAVDVAGGDDAAVIAETGPFRTALHKLAALGVEGRGIEPVGEADRVDKNVGDNFFLWISVNCVITTFPLGLLNFGLGLWDSVWVMLVFNVLGCSTVAFAATLGPLTGLRQMVLTRYSFGWWGAALLALLNVVTQMGFSVIAVLLAGQTLNSVAPGLPVDAGIIIVSVLTLLICFFGYKYVHVVERYAWIVVLIIFVLLYAAGAPYFSVTESDPPSGTSYSAAVLSFASIIYGSAAGWAPVAADYNMMLPRHTSSVKVFLLTFFGLFFPLVFVELLGILYSTALANNEDWGNDYYNNGGNAALLADALGRYGSAFGSKFLLFVLALSAVLNNTPNVYSTGLSFQVMGTWMQKIPRAFWTVLATVVVAVAAIAGQSSFSTILSNLTSILGYWTTAMIVVLALEHMLFRGGYASNGAGYDPAAYDDPNKLPIGLAGWLTLAASAGAAAVGMSQVWFQGPAPVAAFGADVAKEPSGDMGSELVALVALVVYPVARYLEKRYVGR